MKIVTLILGMFMMTASLSLLGQVTKPRMLYVELRECYRNPVIADTVGYSFKAILRGVTRDHNFTGFGFLAAKGGVYAKIQLGNFGMDWREGDIVSMQVKRDKPLALGEPFRIAIPEGSSTIMWGVSDEVSQTYPGSPLRLCPVILKVSTDSGNTYRVYMNGVDTGGVVGQNLVAESERDISGVVSLSPPPSGYRWEPAKQLVTLRDFEFSEFAYTDADGVARPGWARTLEFRLVPSDPEG